MHHNFMPFLCFGFLECIDLLCPHSCRMHNKSSLCHNCAISMPQLQFWDCIQARTAWRWAAFIMHEFCEVRINNYDSFHWKQALFGEMIPKKFVKKIKIQHLLRDITLWTIWIGRNYKVYSREQWHKSKVKHLVWGDLIMYAKATWEQVVKQVKISIFSAEAMLQGYDQTWSVRNVLCRRDNMKINWNWKWQRNQVAQLLGGQFGGLGVVLGQVGPRGFSVVGLSWFYFLRGGVSRLRGPCLPSKWVRFSQILYAFDIGFLAFCLKISNNNKIEKSFGVRFQI